MRGVLWAVDRLKAIAGDSRAVEFAPSGLPTQPQKQRHGQSGAPKLKVDRGYWFWSPPLPPLPLAGGRLLVGEMTR